MAGNVQESINRRHRGPMSAMDHEACEHPPNGTLFHQRRVRWVIARSREASKRWERV